MGLRERVVGGVDERAAYVDRRQVDAGLQNLLFELVVYCVNHRLFLFGLGLRVGGDYLMQSFDTRGTAPNRSQLIGRLAPLARIEFTPTSGLTIGIAFLGLLVTLGEPAADAAAPSRL